MFAHIFLGSPWGEHCNSLEGNVGRKVFPISKKRLHAFWRERERERVRKKKEDAHFFKKNNNNNRTRFLAAVSCVNLVFPPFTRKLNSNYPLNLHPKEFNAAFFGKFLLFLLGNLRDNCTCH